MEIVTGSLVLDEFQIPRIAYYRYLVNEYIEMEEVEIAMKFHQFSNLIYRSKHAPLIEKAEAALVEFAASTAELVTKGDLRSDQLAYVIGRGWVLLDWNATPYQYFHPTLRRESYSNNLFDVGFHGGIGYRSDDTKTWERDQRIMWEWWGNTMYPKIAARIHEERSRSFGPLPSYWAAERVGLPALLEQIRALGMA